MTSTRRIDGREDVVDEGLKFTGFHRLEKDLWVDGLQSDSSAIADQLLTDVKEIVAKAKGVTLNPLQLANGAKALLDEVAVGKITGEEDRYSHTDLYDFDENVKGSKAAIDALRPVIKARDAALLTEDRRRLRSPRHRARQVPHRLGVPALHRAQQGPGQGAVRRGRRGQRGHLEGRRSGRGHVTDRHTEHQGSGSPTGDPEASVPPAVTRRRLLGVGAGAAVVGAVAGVGGAYAAQHGSPSSAPASAADEDVVTFRGERQAGIITPAQDRMHFVALDVITKDGRPAARAC